MDGILNINKASGTSSFGVVAAVKRICHQKHVGHGGTLDPMATGVLPVCVGRGTRVAEYLLEARKTYRAEVMFGATTDTGDAEGKVLTRCDASGLTQPEVSAILEQFRGTIEQVPPMYSALKYKGQPLYKLARAGTSVERPARSVTIYDITLRSWNSPCAAIDVTCSRGTYIRVLAEDIGRALGCGAYLAALTRTMYGPFDISASVTLAELEELVKNDQLGSVLAPVDSVLEAWPVMIADDESADSLIHGRPLSVSETEVKDVIDCAFTQGRCRAYALDGHFLGVLRFNSEKSQWQPEKVFS